MSEIKTARLSFGPYVAKDQSDYIRLVTDPEVMRHVEGREVTAETAVVWWNRLINGLFGKGIRWCVRSLVDKRYIGHAMINYTRPGGACELGYILSKQEWGKGYATEIAAAIAEYSRDKMGLKEIYGTVDEGFRPSIRVLEKIGMKFCEYDYDDDGRYLVYILKHRGKSD